MSWVVLGLIGWMLYGLVGRLIDRFKASAATVAPQRSAVQYALSIERNRALALAHPMGAARIGEGFADSIPRTPEATQELERALRPALLHLFRLRTDMTHAQVRAALHEQLPQRWFALDLDALRPSDDPRDAMAFACARVCFALRAAQLLGWLDGDLQWRLLQHNAERAQDCFTDWHDYGRAWARGRRQWVAGSRADSLGIAFSEVQVDAWLADPAHPWHQCPWQLAAEPATQAIDSAALAPLERP